MIFRLFIFVIKFLIRHKMKFGEIISKKSQNMRLLGDYPYQAVVSTSQITIADLLSPTNQKLEKTADSDYDAEFLSLPVGKGSIVIKASSVHDQSMIGSIEAVIIIKSIHGESQQELSFEMLDKVSLLTFPLCVFDKYGVKGVYIDDIYQVKVLVSKPYKVDVSVLFDKEIL